MSSSCNSVAGWSGPAAFSGDFSAMRAWRGLSISCDPSVSIVRVRTPETVPTTTATTKGAAWPGSGATTRVTTPSTPCERKYSSTACEHRFTAAEESTPSQRTERNSRGVLGRGLPYVVALHQSNADGVDGLARRQAGVINRLNANSHAVHVAGEHSLIARLDLLERLTRRGWRDERTSGTRQRTRDRNGRRVRRNNDHTNAQAKRRNGHPPVRATHVESCSRIHHASRDKPSESAARILKNASTFRTYTRQDATPQPMAVG
jgi:hypothetical protein